MKQTFTLVKLEPNEFTPPQMRVTLRRVPGWNEYQATHRAR